MSTDHTPTILSTICEIRDLVRLMAEPQIAVRDQKLRDELIGIVGKSAPKQQSVLLMDGGHTQTDIHRMTGIDKGYLSTLVKQLSQNALLLGEPKKPKLAISIPTDFFDASAKK